MHQTLSAKEPSNATSYNRFYFDFILNKSILYLTNLTCGGICLWNFNHGNLQNNLSGMQSALQDHAAGLRYVQYGNEGHDPASATDSSRLTTRRL